MIYLYNSLNFKKNFVWKTSLTIFLLFQVGCSFNTDSMKGNSACTYTVDLPAQLEQCTGTVDVVYQYINGHASTALREHSNPFIMKYYSAQKHPSTCFAAALKTAFNLQGYNKKQEDFINALGHSCTGVDGYSPTLSQIIFSATKATNDKNKGTWYVDTPDNRLSAHFNSLSNDIVSFEFSNNGSTISNKTEVPLYFSEKVCQSSSPYGGKSTSNFYITHPNLSILFKKPSNPFLKNPLPNNSFSNNVEIKSEIKNLYRPIKWTANKSNGKPSVIDGGGIVPIKDTGDLVYHFERNVPVIIGMSGENIGHVVTLTKLSYRPGNIFDYDKSNTKIWNLNTRLETIQIMDPATPKNKFRDYDDGDLFLKNVQFMFAIYGG